MDKNVGITMEQLFQILAKMDENQQKNLMSFAQEINKGTPEQQKKREDDRARELKRAKEAVDYARVEQEAKERVKKTCPHATTHPGTGVTKHAWRAQVHAPAGVKPYFVPLCQICLTQGPKIIATTDMLTNGVNLDKYTGITLEVLENWAKSSAA